MPRTSIRSPGYCRHKAKGLAYVELSGQVYYLGPWQSAASKAEYSRLLAIYHAHGGRMPAGQDATIAEMLDRYREHCESFYRRPDGTPTGESHNIGFACRPLRELYGARSAADFGPLDLQAVRQAMVDGQRWSRSLINASIRKIVRAFKWAAAQEIVSATTYHALKTVDPLKAGRCNVRESRPVEAVDDATIAATVKHLPPIVADMVRLQRLIGCRPDELCRLRPIDIDRSRDTVWVYTPALHKTAWRGKDRRVFIAGEAMAILAKYLDRDPEAFCFSPQESLAGLRAERHERRVTPIGQGNKPGSNRRAKPKRRIGDRYCTRAYSHSIRVAAKRAGVEPWSANRLRHAAARDVQAAFGIEAAAAALGNSPEVCKLYAGANFSLAERVAIEMAQRRQSQSPPEPAA